MPTDFELLDAWRSGDAKAGNALFSRHFEHLVRFFFNKVDDAEVEDLIQRTLLACVESRDRFRGHSTFRTYLFTIARNELRQHFRRRRRTNVDLTVSSVCDLGTSPSTAAVNAEDQQLLLMALRRLPVDQQITLELHYWEGLKGTELAEVFQVDAATIRTRLHRCRQLLKKTMAELSQSPALRDRALGGLDTWARNLPVKRGSDDPADPSDASDPSGPDGE